MKKEYGTAIKEFLKNRDYSDASKDLKRIYRESKAWDDFISEAKFIGFNWSQIYYVKNLFSCYDCNDTELLKWLILHILYQYEVGNLRTPFKSIADDLKEWLPDENPPIDCEDFAIKVPQIVKSNPDIFGIYKQPFLIKGDFIYINKIKKYEEIFLELLNTRLTYDSVADIDLPYIKKSLEEKMTYPLEGSRMHAVEKALRKNFIIISGGPGTGKTTTVVSIIRGLLLTGINNILLAAPTGRAAKRMIESINHEKVDEDAGMPTEAFTLHKLLGIIPNRDRPKYHRERTIPAQVVIVDEASMVDIHMMYRLFDALEKNTKLILVGDKDQLPSVEAGALLGDFLYNFEKINHKMRDSIVILEKSYRSIKGIMDCAKLVISGNDNEVINYLNGDVNEITTKELPEVDSLVSEITKKYKIDKNTQGFNIPVSEYQQVKDEIESLFRAYENFTVLIPTKKGLLGTFSINKIVRKYFNSGYAPFYHGEPIMITRNDYINGLFNGDRGVIISFSDGLYAFFKEQDGYKVVSISKITDYETAYAGTVHKSQGSEFDSVAVVIPEGSEKLLTREILYTALTRARKEVLIFANEKEIRTAVKRKIVRHSGIRRFLLS